MLFSQVLYLSVNVTVFPEFFEFAGFIYIEFVFVISLKGYIVYEWVTMKQVPCGQVQYSQP